jgi:hypothetical protein
MGLFLAEFDSLALCFLLSNVDNDTMIHMRKAAKEVAYFLNNRPLCFLSTVFAIRDFVIGLALLTHYREIAQTVLYHNLNELASAGLFGVILMVIAVVTGVTAIADRKKWTQWGLQFSAWFWLFACISYMFSGTFLFAAIFGLMCSIPAGYVSFYYKHTPIWEEPRRHWRREHGLEAR